MPESISVLLVAGDGDLAEMLRGRLEAAAGDFTVERVTDAAAALESLQVATVDCVLSAQELPDRDGLDLLGAVRDEQPDLPFVLFADGDSPDLAERAIDSGAADYLPNVSASHARVLETRIRNAVRAREAGAAVDPLEPLPDAVFAIDDEGTVREANAAARALFDAGDEAVSGRDLGDLVESAGLDEAFHRAYREAATDGAETASVEFTATGDGDERTYEARFARADGWTVATVRDVTALRRRERELDLYEQAVEATGDGIAILNEEAEFLLVNSWFAESVGLTKEELEGQTVSAEESDVILDAPDDLTERWLETGEQARETGRSTFLYESVIDLPRGIHTIENRVTAVRQEGGEVVYVVVSRDITERKEREEQIEELHAATRTLMAAESDADVAAEVVAAVESTLGFPANVVRLVDDAGEHLETAAVTESARELLGEPRCASIPVDGNALGEAFRTDEGLLVDDVREHTDVFDDSAVRSVLSVPIGEYGILSIVDDDVGAYDESDVRIAEILTSNAEAALTRVEKEAQLREREAALSRQLDRLDQFASIVSHDLRNPLNVAKGRLGFVEQQVDDAEHVAAIDGALERMQAIIDDVLTLAREGDEATDVAPLSLREAAESCWETVDTRNATLEVDAERPIVADSSRLKQLLENLLRNAVEHVGDDVTIRIGALDDGFYVEDDGPGIPPAERERVFEPGYSTGDGGTGFGLNIVRTIAEAHGWSVEVTEGGSGGARFEFAGVDSPGVEAADQGSTASS